MNKWIKFLLDKMVQETLQAQDVGIGQRFEGDGGEVRGRGEETAEQFSAPELD